ncbi:MAG: hypothetical protein ACYDGN_13195 [Acidimicrobiales bacterium]
MTVFAVFVLAMVILAVLVTRFAIRLNRGRSSGRSSGQPYQRGEPDGTDRSR